MDVFSASSIQALPLETFHFQAIMLNERGEITERRDGQAYRFQEELEPGVILEMIAVSGGTFQMGSPRGQGYEDETPRHLVSLAPFLIAAIPVTQQQWQAVMKKAPGCRCIGPNLPVERVSWKAAETFCQRLSKRTGRDYRLPTEAQWEYACRAGTATPFSTGDTITTDYANYCGNHVYRGEPQGVYRHVSTPAGTFPPNPYGIQDMHANLWEFCADRWHADYSGAPFDGAAWDWSGEPHHRVARGGSWHEPPVNCRSAARLRVAEDTGDDLIGFRVALIAQ